MRRAALAIVLGSLLAVPMGACGGSGSPAAKKPPASTTTSTTAAPADQATIELAKKAYLTAEDLGAAWVVDTPPMQTQADTACDTAPDDPILALAPGAIQAGPAVHYKATKYYLGSLSIVFPTEAAATRWIEIRKSPAFVECRRAQLEADQKRADKRFTIVTRATTTDGLGQQGFEVYTRYQSRVDEGQGVRDANGTLDRYIYRLGRTVIAVTHDTVASDTDPKDLATRFNDESYRALLGAYRRVQG